MTHVESIVKDYPTIRVGIGGNYYIVCSVKYRLEDFCNMIGKKPSSIKFHKKYLCWVVRIKNKKQKEILKGYMIC